MLARLSTVALGLACCLMLASALMYPGGSWLHPHSSGFSLLENFWCDLTRRPAHNGQPNSSSAALATLAFTALGLALAPFWLQISRLLPAATGRLVRRAGVLSAVGTALVALLPSDAFPRFHPPIVLTAAALGLVSGLIVGRFALVNWRRFPWLAWSSVWLLLASFLNAALYVVRIYFHGSETVWLPLSQKVATLGLVVWMACGLRAGAAPGD